MSYPSGITISPLQGRPLTQDQVNEHHIGNPPRAFTNPWASAEKASFLDIFSAKFTRTEGRNSLPVPTDRSGLVQVIEPTWGAHSNQFLKATWLGHASFLVEIKSRIQDQRGIRVIFDPVFSERTSPVQWLGPKRYSPLPCSIEEVPEFDVLAISHNHYDHLDSWTVSQFWNFAVKHGRSFKIACALGNKRFFISLIPEIDAEDVIELDWWDGIRLSHENYGCTELFCTPAQHTSARGVGDRDKSLWCSWVFRGEGEDMRSLFFAGDTGYRHVKVPNPTPEEEASMPVCPAFKEIGQSYGPFDLALLPIGLYSPRDLMSTVHCSPEDSVAIHFDVKSKKSIGMHYGTFRGGISQHYEDVLEPPRRWREKGEQKKLVWDKDFGLCAIGETVTA